MIDAADSLSHRTMLMVLYSTGMRNAELRHLQVADLDSRRMLIHIQRGKGGRDRYVPLSHAADDAARVLPVDAGKDVAVSRDRRRVARRQAHHTKVLWDACVVAARHAGLRKCCSPRPIRPGIFHRRRWLEPYRRRDVKAAATSPRGSATRK